jgi:hypothetical protein
MTTLNVQPSFWIVTVPPGALATTVVLTNTVNTTAPRNAIARCFTDFRSLHESDQRIFAVGRLPVRVRQRRVETSIHSVASGSIEERWTSSIVLLAAVTRTLR